MQNFIQNIRSGVKIKFFTVNNMQNSHLSHKRTRRSFSERRDAHNDTKNMWEVPCYDCTVDPCNINGLGKGSKVNRC